MLESASPTAEDAAAEQVQRYARGLIVRAHSARLARAVTISHRHHREQRKSCAAQQLQLATRGALQRRASTAQQLQLTTSGALQKRGSLAPRVEARPEYESGGWQHAVSEATLKRTLAGGAAGASAVSGEKSWLGESWWSRPLLAWTSRGERVEAQQAYSDSPGDSAAGESRLVEHCGWLLKQGRAVSNWKVRWVVVQASCIWYFKDDSRSELLGRMALANAAVEIEDARYITVRSPQRKLLLLAASEAEARTWALVLRRCVVDIEQASKRSSHAADLPTRSGMPGKADGLAHIVRLLVSSTPATSSAQGGEGGGEGDSEGGEGGGDGLGRSAAQEETLCILLLTIHTFGEPIEAVARELSARYDESLRSARHVAYVLQRWKELHSHHFAREASLRTLWQRAATDGHLSGRHMAPDGTLLLQADTGVWLPFRSPPLPTSERRVRLIRGLGGESEEAIHVVEVALTRLSTAEMRQAVACLTHATAAAATFSSKAAASPWAVGAPWVAKQQKGRRDVADERLSRELATAMRRALPPDSAAAEQWLAVDAAQLARYLTLYDEQLYHAVGHAHLLSYVWKTDDEASSKGPLLRLTQRFNEVACVVASALVSTPDVGTRAALFSHFVAVGSELRRLANFNALMAILAALGSAAVHRLKATRAKIGPKSEGLWAALSRLMSHDGSYHEYRLALAAARRSPPFIPYLGVHLTDLTFLGDGTKDELDGSINLRKRQQVHGVLSSCLAGRSAHYPFSALPGIAKLVEATPHLSQDELYRSSLLREPRATTQGSPIVRG